MTEKKGRGRPPGKMPIPQDKAESLIAWLGEGKTLREWCRLNGLNHGTVYLWMGKDAVFAERVARAREDGHEVLVQECLEIADDARNDWMERRRDDGSVAGVEFDKEHVQRSKLRIETRLKLLAVWNPAKYGERKQIEHSGRIGLESLIAGDE